MNNVNLVFVDWKNKKYCFNSNKLDSKVRNLNGRNEISTGYYNRTRGITSGSFIAFALLKTSPSGTARNPVVKNA